MEECVADFKYPCALTSAVWLLQQCNPTQDILEILGITRFMNPITRQLTKEAKNFVSQIAWYLLVQGRISEDDFNNPTGSKVGLQESLIELIIGINEIIKSGEDQRFVGLNYAILDEPIDDGFQYRVYRAQFTGRRKYNTVAPNGHWTIKGPEVVSDDIADKWSEFWR